MKRLYNVATCGYNIYMDNVKTVGIKKLKDNLSAYIRDVRNGSVILVTDHGTVVAEIRTPQREYSHIKRNALRQKWIDSNKLHVPSEDRKTIFKSSVSLPAGTSIRLLDLDRRE
jgi:antitoxin (DNA-binding transcriptional repressor) of toxin-antitoxin stability system